VPDHRVRCPVVDPDGAEAKEANAFRSFCDGGNEFVLDFINCPEEADYGEVVARVRIHREVLQAVFERLRGSVEARGGLIFSAALEG